jgi:hypothetical protein
VLVNIRQRCFGLYTHHSSFSPSLPSSLWPGNDADRETMGSVSWVLQVLMGQHLCTVTCNRWLPLSLGSLIWGLQHHTTVSPFHIKDGINGLAQDRLPKELTQAEHGRRGRGGRWKQGCAWARAALPWSWAQRRKGDALEAFRAS